MKGRILGVDYGTRRVGLAVCDPDQIIASPLITMERKDDAADADVLQQIIQAERISQIVVGLPIHNDGREGEKAAEARKYGNWLQQITALPVRFWDERFTTSQAESSLWQAGLTHKKRKDRRDRVAAQMMLQSYLDAGCPDDDGAGPLAGKPGDDPP
jgi:putative Holliday junction resolvase